MKDPQFGRSIEVSHERAIQEWEEIPLEKNTMEDLHCTPAMHTRYRSLLGQTNWLHSRIQFQCCSKFSRCASKAASAKIGDVKALNKFWPLAGSLRITGFPDASYRNNEDESSQRGMTVPHQKCENVPRRMECHMEVSLTSKVKRSRRLYSQQA